MNNFKKLENKKIIVIGIPRTGNNFIRNYMKNNKSHGHFQPTHHLSFNNIWYYTKIINGNKKKQIIKYNKNNYYITIIRNPFDLLVSYYVKQYKNGKKGKLSFKQYILNIDKKWNESFLEDFVTRYYLFLFIPYIQIFNNTGEIMVDCILKYENFNYSMSTIFQKKINTLRIVDKTPNKTNYKMYYDKELIELLSKRWKLFLDLFNYDFNGSTDNKKFILKNELDKNKLEKIKLKFNEILYSFKNQS